MNKFIILLKTIALLISLFLTYWGTKLIYNIYLHQKILLYKVKFNQDLGFHEAHLYFYERLSKTLFVQLGLVVISTIFATLLITSLIKSYKQDHK